MVAEGKQAASALSADDVAGCRAVFQLLDTDGSGTISQQEVQKLLRLLGFSASRAEVDKLMKEIDADGNGEISFDEFVAVLTGLRRPSYRREDLQHAFHLLATKDTPAHHISSDVLRQQLVSLCRVSQSEASRLVDRVSNGAPLVNVRAALAQYL